MILIAKPRPITLGSHWVIWAIRGGSWACVGENYRSSYRIGYRPAFRYDDLGFRVILRKRG